MTDTLTIRRPDAIRPWQHVLEPLSGYLKVAEALLASIEQWLARSHEPAAAPNAGPDVHRDAEPPHGHVGQAAIDAVMRDHHEVHRLLDATLTEPLVSTHVDDRLDLLDLVGR